MDMQDIVNRCSNTGRWGAGDQRGTLNFIDDAIRLRAFALVRSGVVVSVGRELGPGTMQHLMLAHSFKSDEVVDYIGIACHGHDITHLDSLGHLFWQGRTYNGLGPEIVGRTALAELSMAAYGDGIATRGVLLDLPRAMGADKLEAGHLITVAELEAAERALGIQVGTGDALFVRTGKAVQEGDREPPTEQAPWPGLSAECVPWLHDREIALYSGDCVERLPGVDPELPLPLHQLGICLMGLCLLDWSDVEPLAVECERQQRWEFLTIVAPLRVPGVTGCAVNPLCFF